MSALRRWEQALLSAWSRTFLDSMRNGGCSSPEDTVMPCCQAAWRRGKPFRARLHSSSGVVMPLSASAMSFSDKLELTHAWAVLEARDPLRD